jgi:putative transposase
MFVLEFKVKGNLIQYKRIDEAVKTAQFIRNKCIRLWMDGYAKSRNDLYLFTTRLAKEFGFVDQLNSMARQASCERAWASVARFYENCKRKIKGKKGYPRFKKNCRSVEYKTSGYKLSADRRRITFTDKKFIGKLKLIGSRDLNYFEVEQIKRVRLVRRADGYYCQFLLDKDVRDGAKEFEPTKLAVGLDLGLKYFIADSNGKVESSPRFYRKSEKKLNRANRKKSKKYRKGAKPQSKNYHKARVRYAKKHLRVSRQREEYVKKLAYCVIQSNDLVAYEDLNIKGLVRNRRLAKSISDAGWSSFRRWLEYFGWKYGKATVAVPPHYTSQNCSNCGQTVKKALSVRTHVCPHCGYVEDRDINASINILKLGLRTVGHTGTYATGDLPSSSVGESLLGYGDSSNVESHGL